jgi:hypothetical protein
VCLGEWWWGGAGTWQTGLGVGWAAAIVVGSSENGLGWSPGHSIHR